MNWLSCVNNPKKVQITTRNFVEIKTTRLPAFLEGLNSSLPLSAGEFLLAMCQDLASQSLGFLGLAGLTMLAKACT